MPEASTSATNVAIGGATAAGCTAADAVTGAGTTVDAVTGAGTTVVAVTVAGTSGVDGVAGVEVVVTAGSGAEVVGVAVPARAALAMVLGVVRVRSGLEDRGDGPRWRSTATKVVTAKVAATPMATKWTGRRLKNVRAVVRAAPVMGPVADPLLGVGEGRGEFSTMC